MAEVVEGLLLTIAGQLDPRGYGEDVGTDVVLALEHLSGAQSLLHADAGCEQGDLEHVVALGLLVEVDALVQSLDIEAFRLGRLVDRLVVDRQVVHDVLAAAGAVHAVDALADKVRDLVGEGRVVGDDCGVGRSQDLGVSVHVL